MNKAWIYVITGGFMDIIWAIFLKLSNNFTNIPYSAITIIFLLLAFFLFSKAMTQLPSGVAYTVFTGIGTMGTIVCSSIFLHESLTLVKIFFSTILIAAIINLKLATDKKGA